MKWGSDIIPFIVDRVTESHIHRVTESHHFHSLYGWVEFFLCPFSINSPTRFARSGINSPTPFARRGINGKMNEYSQSEQTAKQFISMEALAPLGWYDLLTYYSLELSSLLMSLLAQFVAPSLRRGGEWLELWLAPGWVLRSCYYLCVKFIYWYNCL